MEYNSSKRNARTCKHNFYPSTGYFTFSSSSSSSSLSPIYKVQQGGGGEDAPASEDGEKPGDAAICGRLSQTPQQERVSRAVSRVGQSHLQTPVNSPRLHPHVSFGGFGEEAEEARLPLSALRLKSVMHVSDCMEVKVPRRYSLLWETHITKMKEWSFLCWNEITYVDEVYTTPFLSSGAKRILYEPNAGGNSEVSEAISFEILYRFFSASLDHTEMEIKYMFRNSKKTDYSVRIFGERVGVSVTRAMRYGSLISTEDAERLLRKKLSGILVSTENVITPHEWKRQILHIFCRNKYEAGIVAKAFLRMDRELKGSTIVMLTITNSLQVF
eukprot:CAMPEP_0113879444 /NCGR_PEP_ID=MMETSP0780_2-20120614/7242_1 /TAXON_ID=652834 /ORGANISM="Palpitomonas bilix" /LENGTH=328 /DNA_ID=CAMNT_0000866027 /DNA_START=82 /DNA_END=1069 /DNA_ORIENTATION=+ /assembly_acc=CAM_ASM_000599